MTLSLSTILASIGYEKSLYIESHGEAYQKERQLLTIPSSEANEEKPEGLDQFESKADSERGVQGQGIVSNGPSSSSSAAAASSSAASSSSSQPQTRPKLPLPLGSSPYDIPPQVTPLVLCTWMYPLTLNTV